MINKLFLDSNKICFVPGTTRVLLQDRLQPKQYFFMTLSIEEQFCRILY